MGTKKFCNVGLCSLGREKYEKMWIEKLVGRRFGEKETFKSGIKIRGGVFKTSYVNPKIIPKVWLLKLQKNDLNLLIIVATKHAEKETFKRV